MVYEIHEDGAIANDSRLSCGDQILEVCVSSIICECRIGSYISRHSKLHIFYEPNVTDFTMENVKVKQNVRR